MNQFFLMFISRSCFNLSLFSFVWFFVYMCVATLPPQKKDKGEEEEEEEGRGKKKSPQNSHFHRALVGTEKY